MIKNSNCPLVITQLTNLKFWFSIGEQMKMYIGRLWDKICPSAEQEFLNVWKIIKKNVFVFFAVLVAVLDFISFCFMFIDDAFEISEIFLPMTHYKYFYFYFMGSWKLCLFTKIIFLRFHLWIWEFFKNLKFDL
jgi:hypothetical protein